MFKFEVMPREGVPVLGKGWVAKGRWRFHFTVRGRGKSSGRYCHGLNITRDSDATSATAGTLLGAMYGGSMIPPRLLTSLEQPDVIGQVAHNLIQIPDFNYECGSEEWLSRCPAN